MSNVFEVLKRMGGVVEENGVTYVTHPTPPAGDNSQKIATTAWVKDITDRLEASVSGGMFPKIQNAILSGNGVYTPAGGTWWVIYGTSICGSFSGGVHIYDLWGDSNKEKVKYFSCIKNA